MKDGSMLAYFSPISILLGLAISILQLYVTSRQAKLKETIIDLIRKEMKDELKDMKAEILDTVKDKMEIQKGAIIQELRK